LRPSWSVPFLFEAVIHQDIGSPKKIALSGYKIHFQQSPINRFRFLIFGLESWQATTLYKIKDLFTPAMIISEDC
jgi:hypothetical protein